MKEKLKRRMVYEFFMVVNNFIKEKMKEDVDKRFSYAVHLNLENLESEIKAINEAKKPSAKYEEYQQKKTMIGEKYSDKDENGKPILVESMGNQIYKVEVNKEEATKEIIKLNEEYSETIKERQKGLKEFQELMEEEVEVDICKISFKYFPDKYNIFDHGIIKLMIKETKEEMEALLLA
jgi:hypothetical protein